MRIVPMEAAKAKPVGAARENPNMEPYLPPPIGRIEFSLNPFKMLVSFPQNFILCTDYQCHHISDQYL